MNRLVELIGVSLAALSWLVGIVLAQGFWLTTLACFIPPYAWYLIIERAMRHWGLV